MKNGVAFGIGVLVGGIGVFSFDKLNKKNKSNKKQTIHCDNDKKSLISHPQPRLKTRYIEEIKPALKATFGYQNVMQIPTLTKVCVHMSFSEGAIQDLTTMTGQKPKVTKSREGIPIGVLVTLRNNRMWEFTDHLLSVSLPRTHKLSPNQFDGKGNYAFSFTDKRIMDITFVTTAKNDAEGYELLKQLGFPFRE